MPSKGEHIDWTQHNEAFWNSFALDASPFIDWVVTGIFYEAVHWVEAFLATKGRHSGSHKERSTAMHRFAQELAPIQTDYDTLKLDSMAARYSCHMHTSQEVTQDLTPLVTSVRNHISSLVT